MTLLDTYVCHFSCLALHVVCWAALVSVSQVDASPQVFGVGLATLGTAACGLNSCSTSLGECTLCAVSRFAIPIDDMDDVRDVCSGDMHALFLTQRGLVFGAGPRALLGLGEATNATSCNSPTSAVWLGVSTASRIACIGNMSMVTLRNGTALFFGQAPSAGIIAETDSWVTSPTALGSLLLGVSAPQQDQTVQHCGLGLDAIVCVMTNGSVLTTGTGVLSGTLQASSSWWRVLPTPPCGSAAHSVAQLSVGSQHALLLCQNGALLGFGDNSFGQLDADQTVFTVVSPTRMSFSGSRTIVAVDGVAAGYSHSLVLAYVAVDGTTNGTLALFGAGENSKSALGSSKNLVGDVVYGLTELPLPTMSSDSIPSAVVAGRQASILLVRHSGHDGSLRAASNVYATGTNQYCALGGSSLVAANGVVSQWTLMPLAPVRRYNVTSAHLSFARRLLLVGNEYPTMTPTWPHDTLTTTPTRTWPSYEPTMSLSKRTNDQSLTNTVTISRATRSPTLTAISPSAALSSTVTRQLGPRVSSVFWENAGRVLTVEFDIPTNTPSSRVDALFTITGLLQTFGEASMNTGTWPTHQLFQAVFLATSSVNITPAVATVGIRTDGGVVLLSQGGSSLPSLSGAASSVAVSPGAVPQTVVTGFGPQATVAKIGAAVGAGIFGVLVIIATIALCLRYHEKRVRSVNHSPSDAHSATHAASSEPSFAPAVAPVRPRYYIPPTQGGVPLRTSGTDPSVCVGNVSSSPFASMGVLPQRALPSVTLNKSSSAEHPCSAESPPSMSLVKHIEPAQPAKVLYRL